ncbi:TlyA family RNA methyltransferase [Anaeromyxobacter diazotrophicus]|uniref:TlyA family rRNA (Cytidine-2'-O)-methyltransferase n=1 Tax=Anaeromyxobacter diazotrophicus TaxID=2590199 RepID=A0A7I9VT96_9BACT|nr:TlyA family RNA methyltransferase [Anaeromyxobacter diazotrophicus]GEJ59458.1 TlyA family rRNA (cytidine-2'-O)-methyltransferase [Anaeromyxobacter diazotrophicus]
MRKQRIDLLLVEQGLAASRTQAQALVMAGAVVAGEQRVDKPGQLVDPALPLRVKDDAAPQKYVSRGALKLERALAEFPVDPRGKVCADLGASTGGFTDLLLQRGAAKVFAVDVGYGQLHPRLRGDPRVVVRERENARHLDASSLGGPVDLVTGDLSFISLRLVLPAVRALLRPGGAAVLLVKPQFEVGKGEVGKGGVVRDDAQRREALEQVKAAARALGFEVTGEAESPIEGPAGNREWLLGLALGGG